MREQEGFIPVGEYRVWYRIVGGGADHEDIPLLTLHALITSGRYDESTPLLNEVLHNGIAGSEWFLFEQSSHMAHVEERELYLSTVKAFIEGVEVMLK